jgi:Fe-S cluster assembly iron-binding protein IscA
MKQLLILLISATFLHAQGPLTPPGAPAPTMKTLDQVEARRPIPPSPATPVSGPHFTITEPGSYYFTGNVTVTDGPGIVITANNVTLDLNGFTLACSASSQLFISGIDASSAGSNSNLTVANGNIHSNSTVYSSGTTAAGWYNGIVTGAFASPQIRNLNVSGMGAAAINAIGGSVIQCSVSNCYAGIRAAVVSQSTVDWCWHIGIEAASTVSQSHSRSLNADGITAGTVTGCESSGRTSGITATTVSDSTGTASSNSGASYGIYCENANNSTGTGSTHGIYAAQNVKGCTGKTTRTLYIPLFKQYGIYCQNAIASSGESFANTNSTGIFASGNVSDCTGKATNIIPSSSINLIGIECSNASNSNGTGHNRGIRAFANATNCYGKAYNIEYDGIGIDVDGTASFCRCDHDSWFGRALRTNIAIGCTKAEGIMEASSKQLGTP